MCPLPGDNNLCHELQFPATVTHIDHTFLHFPSQLSLEGKTTTTSLSLSISLKHHANNPSPTHKSPSEPCQLGGSQPKRTSSVYLLR